MKWDSEGGHPAELFLPVCADCGHDVRAHEWHETGVSRRRCTTHDPAMCECRKYRAGDPKDWAPLPPRQDGLF